jgi:hypothetical protein
MVYSQTKTLEELRQTIRGLERSALSERPRSFIATGLRELDAALPGGGLPAGSLVELLADDGMSAWALALRLARRAIQSKAAWAVVDMDGTFYPPAAAELGVDLEKLVVVRAQGQRAIWAYGQLLGCPEVGAAFLSLVPAPRGGGLNNITYRRFQLAAERGGNLGFIVRPADAVKKPCWAALRLLASASPEGAVQLTLLHVRGGRRESSVIGHWDRTVSQ